MLSVLLAAVAALWLHRLLAGFATMEALAVVSLANATFFAAAWLAMKANGTPNDWTGSQTTIQIVISLFFDLPLLALLLWLTRTVEPFRFAARYLLVPLFTVLEGCVVLRPEVTVRSACGALLLTVGAWRLLTAKVPLEESWVMLR